MLKWFPRLQVATACFSCSPPDLNFLDPYFIFMYMHYNHCHRATAHLQFIIIIIIIIIISFSLQAAPDGWIPHTTRSGFRFPYNGLLRVFIIADFYFQQFLYELRYSLCFISDGVIAASCRLVKWALLWVSTEYVSLIVNIELCFRSVA